MGVLIIGREDRFGIIFLCLVCLEGRDRDRDGVVDIPQVAR